MNSILRKYADLLVRYCLEIEENDRLYIRSTTLAEPLVREVFRSAIKAGAFVVPDLSFREQDKILIQEGNSSQLDFVAPHYKAAITTYDAYLYISAPFNLREVAEVNSEKANKRKTAFEDINQVYSKRTATRSLKRNLCQYPTLANAQEAGMSYEDYEYFIYQACKLFDEDPVQSWQKIGSEQQQIVDFLNQRASFRFLGDGTDLTFSTKGRIWINSDGKTNMPSGEVYTSPVDSSVNGTIYFSLPAIHAGMEVEGVRLWVKDGQIQKWNASKGKHVLDAVFKIKGARYFGEAAIGTNYNISRFTKNILFDEKIGGTVHMAIGQSYLQTGGQNTSPIHWDLITEMKNGGTVFADGQKIYENGKFIL